MIASLRTRATPDSTVQETQRRPLGCSVGTCASRELPSSRVLTGAHAINPDQVRRDPGSTWLGRAQRRFLRFSAPSDADVRTDRRNLALPHKNFNQRANSRSLDFARRLLGFQFIRTNGFPDPALHFRVPSGRQHSWTPARRQGMDRLERPAPASATRRLRDPEIQDGVTRPPPRYKEGRLIEATQLRWCSSIPDGTLAR